jgi:hypothetical protein
LICFIQRRLSTWCASARYPDCSRPGTAGALLLPDIAHAERKGFAAFDVVPLEDRRNELGYGRVPLANSWRRPFRISYGMRTEISPIISKSRVLNVYMR